MKKTIKSEGIEIEIVQKDPLKMLQKKISMKEERTKLIKKVREGRKRIYNLSLEINKLDELLDKTMLGVLK